MTVARLETPSDISQVSYEIMEKVLAKGDLKQLTSQERVMLYKQICESLNLNPLTRPFQYIAFDGKLTLYASKDCTEQLRNLHTISVYKVEKEVIDGVFVYTAYLKKANGQEDVGTGAVAIKGLQGKSLANAFKIAETQAKRRGTLSICGLGWTDESEIPDVPNANPVKVDFETGEIIAAEKAEKAKEVEHFNRQELYDAVDNATSLVQLKNAYAKAYTALGGNLYAMQDITALKDERKAEIEASIKEFQDEIKEAEDADYESNTVQTV